MTILVVGGSGFLGSEIIRQAQSAGHQVDATYATRPGEGPPTRWHRLDLRHPSSLDAVLAEVQPEVLINTASARSDWAVTAEGPLHLAITTARRNISLVHVSSDAVFSGTGRIHYDESCRPDPITPYGAAKATAETGVLAVHPKAAVVRTSLIIGYGRSAHERLVHQLAAGTVNRTLFTDDVRCPVHVTDLAASLLEVALSGGTGLHHAAGPDALSRHALGLLIAQRDGLDISLLREGRRADSTTPGALDVRLDSRATQRSLRTRLRGARAFISPTSR
ncbi:SDR family oxidoreductase [Streptomyces sp. NBRC 110465]|uniref:SDR family oxidoreductase n=1 Tax=Streptomyces sp. NBRC 110465 TaxID=1897621 RepID=UPI000932E76C|nr:sugar nucleotide-binding protein [Streptomyces sp. NBRC 110465]